MRTTHFVTSVGTAAVTAAMALIPLPAANPNQSKELCQSEGPSSTVCQSGPDVEIIHTPPPITFYPYGSPPPIAG
jgi:hypothetical protein